MREIMLHLFGYNSVFGETMGVALVEWPLYILLMTGIIIAITVHEFGHAWMADKLGDPGPRAEKRISLSPLAHLDPLGTLLLAVTTLAGFPIGWGKPVRTDPDRYSVGRRQGIALVAAAGPLMNLATALLLTPVARWILSGGLRIDVEIIMYLIALIFVTMLINLSLFVFNLVPIHPLDGSHILAGLLPEDISVVYQKFMARYGVYLLLTLLISGVLPNLIMPLIVTIFKYLVGLP